MKKKRIKQKEDKKTDRKHGNRTRKAILGILSVLVLLCLNSCGRELEEREFPDTLVIRDSALPFEKSLQTEQDKSSKYLDYGQVRCILLEDDLAEDDEKLGEVLLALEKRPAFSRNIYFFTADGKVLEQREKQKEESQDLTGFYQKSTDHKREAATLGSLLYRLHNGSGEHKILKLKEEDGKLVPQNYLNVLKKTENENTAKKTKTKTTKTIHGIEKQTTKETADQIQQGIAKEILRFHVLANSDSEEDQKLKLEVKDRLVDYMKDILDGAEDVKETKKRITENRETICLVAEQEIQKQGYTYPVSVNLEKCYFPMKTYGDCTCPAGTYEALRVCIGKAKGRNWWCVLYPGLCFADSVNVIVPDEKKQELKNILTEEEYESLFDWREDDYQIRSGFLRLWRKLFA